MHNDMSATQASSMRGDYFVANDRLPPSVRYALWEANVDWDARYVRWQLNKQLKSGANKDDANDYIIREIRRWDEEELKRFSHRWPSRFGRYPHVAADASIQTYDGRG